MKKWLSYPGQLLSWLFQALMSIAFAMVFHEVSRMSHQRKILRKKIKHFKPTIHEGFFGKSVSWELRDTPLTDKQIDKL